MSIWGIIQQPLNFNKLYKVMKKYIVTSIILLIASYSWSQTELMHQDVKDNVVGKRGPNLKNFSHFYMGFGFIVGSSDSLGSDVIAGRSTNFVLGYRYKFRISNFFAIGCDAAFNSYSFALKQNSTKFTPDTIIHGKEQLNLGNLGLSGYMRFNYGKRGNRVGNFIDIGGYGDYRISGVNFTKDKLDNDNVVKTRISHLDYFNSINYGALARIGFNRYVLYGTYRLSDIFESSYNYPELPRLTIGLQIGFHK
jgi:hypothetical protein